MIKLLVSVRSCQEAIEAIQGGALLIDLKEPNHGALGATANSVWTETRLAVGGQVPLSAALGELVELEVDQLRHLDGFQFAKIGLARCSTRSDWRQQWHLAHSQLPKGVTPVAVIYADHLAAAAPSPAEILDESRRCGIPVVLFDTYGKQNRTLFDELDEMQLAELIAEARAACMQVAVAGSLSGELIDRACDLRPDWVAVRGAACRNGRLGQVDRSRVAQIVHQLSTTNRPPAATDHCSVH